MRKFRGNLLCLSHRRRASACLPLNSIVIHRADRPLKKSSGGEEGGKGEGNRCSKTVCPLSALLLFQITPQAVNTSGRTMAYWASEVHEGYMLTCQSLRSIWHTLVRQNRPSLVFFLRRNCFFMLQQILKRDPPNPDIWALLAVKIPIWWKD